TGETAAAVREWTLHARSHGMPVHGKLRLVGSVVRLCRRRVEPVGLVDPGRSGIAGADVDDLGEWNHGNVDIAGILGERAELVDEVACGGAQCSDLAVVGH